MLLRKLGIALSVIGLAIAIYLASTRLFHTGLVCGVSSCGIVNGSRYALLLGIPVAFFGVAFYLAMLIMVVLRRYRLFLISSVIGVLFSAYLTYLEAFVIHAWCQWCVFSAWITLCLFIIGYRLFKSQD